jgi:Tol biopolymer transport system component
MVDATDRVQHMDEVRVILERLRSGPAESSRWSKPALATALLALAVTGVVTGVALIWRVPSKPTHSTSPPQSLVTLTSYPGLERDPSFSPDGTQVAFAWHTGNSNGYGIYVKPVISGGLPVKLTQGTAENWGPAWSPDGRRIAFRRQGPDSGIYWVSPSGGSENLVAPIARQGQETLPQMSWSRDGKWIAAPDRDATGATRIYLFAVASGEKRVLTSDASGTDHAPAFSPDGKSIAYAACAGAVFPCDLYVMNLTRDLAPKRMRRITQQGVYIRGLTWLPDGRSLVYSAGTSVSMDTSLWRVSVDPPGPPERIDMAGSQARHPVISRTGDLLAYTRLGKWNLMMIQNFR